MASGHELSLLFHDISYFVSRQSKLVTKLGVSVNSFPYMAS
jgi:hypothetical protein